MTHASNTYVGTTLQQKVEDAWQPLGYFSRKLFEIHKILYVRLRTISHIFRE